MTIQQEAEVIAQGWANDPLSIGLLILFAVLAIAANIWFESQ